MNKILPVIICLILTACTNKELSQQYTFQEDFTVEHYVFPSEAGTHEGTWLNWPHHYTYGKEYRDEIEEIWIEMTDALHTDEAVHIVAYNDTEKKRIQALLADAQIDMSQIDFVIAKSDDVWARDTGPIFVKDANGKMFIADFAFDGWGKKTPFKHDDKIPQAVAREKNIPILDVSDFVLEGGSFEMDGAGTLMATESSVWSKNRNSKLTLEQVEGYLAEHLGVRNFIWLEGVTDEDITDAHIDGIARFHDDKTLLTVSREDFLELYEGIGESDYDALLNAGNANGESYRVIELPMTDKNVEGLDYKGSYLNYYIGNEVVLVPTYHDKNDAKAVDLLGKLYSDREIVPIDVTDLYQYGGMLHCVTQQQPA